jgi:hypothetical protein
MSPLVERPPPRDPAQAPPVQGNDDEPLARHPDRLRERHWRIFQKLEGDHEQCQVHRAVPKGKLMGIAEDHWNPGRPPASLCQHRRRPIESDDPQAFSGKPAGKVPAAAADLEDAPGARKPGQEPFQEGRLGLVRPSPPRTRIPVLVGGCTSLKDLPRHRPLSLAAKGCHAFRS